MGRCGLGKCGVRTEPVMVAHGVAERPDRQAMGARHGLPGQAGEVENVQRLHLRAACARAQPPVALPRLSEAAA